VDKGFQDNAKLAIKTNSNGPFSSIQNRNQGHNSSRRQQIKLLLNVDSKDPFSLISKLTAKAL
jgi:hypothetical protein